MKMSVNTEAKEPLLYILLSGLVLFLSGLDMLMYEQHNNSVLISQITLNTELWMNNRLLSSKGDCSHFLQLSLPVIGLFADI